MKRWSIYLGICLVFQVVLAVGAHLARTDYGTFKPTETLLSFEPRAIDAIRIDQDNGDGVTLKKEEGEWRIPAMSDFQADRDKVESLLDRLAHLEKGWPVATTSSAVKRFKVGDDNYERKITLFQGEETIDALFLGTSPSFRKVHSRPAGEDAIYAVRFSEYEVNAKPEDWIDREALKHQTSEIARVELPDLSLSLRDGKLIVEEMDEGTEEVVGEEAERLLQRIADLRIRTVLGTEEKPEYNRNDPVFRYTLGLSSGRSEEFVFSKPKDADYYVLKSSHREEYFGVDDWIVDNIKEINRSKLVREKKDTRETA